MTTTRFNCVNAMSSTINKLFVRFKYTGPSLAARELRKMTSLPAALHEAVIGMLLGDAGCFRTSKSLTSNSRLEFSFGRQRLEFALFIEGMLKDYIQTSVTPLLVAATKDGDKIHTSFRLKTIALPVFNYYRELFYKLDSEKGKFVKIVPVNIIDLLSPIVLAHLVMGDGNYYSDSRTIRIYTNGFTHDDVKRLAEAITSKYGINVAVRHDRKQQYILAIGAKEIGKFQELVLPHMHESMMYRIGK